MSHDKSRGRPRDMRLRKAALDTALTLLREEGLGGLSMEAVAAKSGVSKPTLYRWWPDKLALALDAILEFLGPALVFPDTDNPIDGLRVEMRSAIRLMKGPDGKVIKSLFAAAQADPRVAEDLRKRFIFPRRTMVIGVLTEWSERGFLRPDLDVTLAYDLLYAPLFYRLLGGHAPLDDMALDGLLEYAFHGIDNQPA